MKVTCSLLTFAASSLLAASLFAAAPPGGVVWQPRDPAEPQMRAFDGLHLSAAQIAKMRESRNEYAPKFAQAAKRLEDLVPAPTIDTPVPPVSREAAAASQSYQELIDEFHIKLLALLTPEQKEELYRSHPEQRPKGEPAPTWRTVVEPVFSVPADGRADASSETIPPSLEIELPNVRWQPLPDNIESAAVSPDQRVWYLTSRVKLVADSANTVTQVTLQKRSVREVVEREFAKPSPQLQSVAQIFFERESLTGDGRARLKRVWLIGAQVLLGYDGKQWIERKISGHFFRRPALDRSFLQFDGGVAFFDSGGCHVLTGSKWIFLDLGPRATNTDVDAWRDADGKGLTVWLASTRKPTLWRFRSGDWIERPWPEQRYSAALPEPPVKLGDHFYARVGFPDQMKLTAPKRATMGRSEKLPAKPVVLRIGPDGRDEELDAESTLTVGSYKIPLNSPMWNDADGTFYAGCRGASQGGRELGPGLLICDPAGENPRYLTTAAGSLVDPTQLGTPLFLTGGKRAWTAQGLLDMDTLTRIAQLPSTTYEVYAATDDGLAFADAVNSRSGVSYVPQMVFRQGAPDAPDARKHLAAQNVKLNGRGLAVGSDGILWAPCGKFGLACFDGKDWREVNTLQISGNELAHIPITPCSLIPAQNGWVLAYVGESENDIERDEIAGRSIAPTYLMLTPRIFGGGSASFATWIPQIRERFLEAFSTPSTGFGWCYYRPRIAKKEEDGRVWIKVRDISPPAVAVDKFKNIWALSFGSVCVVTEKRAIDVPLPDNPDGTASKGRQLEALGDGQFVFLRTARGATYFARLTAAGEADVSPGPKVFEQSFTYRDPQGGIWLTVEEPAGRKIIDDRETGITIRRVTAPDKGQDFHDVGWPILVDDSGCVWLVPKTQKGGDKATVWLPSGKTTTVKVGGLAGGRSLVAAGKGRVVAQTKGGYQELLADNPDNPEAYTLGTLYALDKPDDELLVDLKYSSLGYLAGIGYKYVAGKEDCVLHLYPFGTSGTPHGATPAVGAAAESQSEGKPGTSSAASKLRTWHDATGSFSLHAEFVSAAAGVAKLRKPDGSTINVPIENLSDADQQFIRNGGK